MQESLTTGQVAQQAGVNIQTLRYYERRKLLARPPRSQGGFRLYPADVVNQVRFIKRAQGLGFSLVEIGELLRIGSAGARCGDVKQRVDRKLADIDQKIAALQKMRTALATLVQTCDDPARACPVFTRLDFGPARFTGKLR